MAGKRSLVYGIGINDSDYKTEVKETVVDEFGVKRRVLLSFCPFFRKWSSMLFRCYNEKYLEKKPTYRDCFVCSDWLLFSNFKSWMETQDWENKVLDKDILILGNKLYSPETCVFVDPAVNTFFSDCAAARGDLPVGVHLDKRSGRYQSVGCNPFTGKRDFLGYYDEVIMAAEAWRVNKESLAKRLADQQTDERVAEALRTRYSPDSEFTKETIKVLMERSGMFEEKANGN